MYLIQRKIEISQFKELKMINANLLIKQKNPLILYDRFHCLKMMMDHLISLKFIMEKIIEILLI